MTALHAKIGRENGQYAANRMLALLSAMFNHAAHLGYEGGNPAHGVKHFKEQSRDRFLRADEIKAFFLALSHEDTPGRMADFFTIALLTGGAVPTSCRWPGRTWNWRGGFGVYPKVNRRIKSSSCASFIPTAVEILRRRADENMAFKPKDQSPLSSGHRASPATSLILRSLGRGPAGIWQRSGTSACTIFVGPWEAGKRQQGRVYLLSAKASATRISPQRPFTPGLTSIPCGRASTPPVT